MIEKCKTASNTSIVRSMIETATVRKNCMLIAAGFGADSEDLTQQSFMEMLERETEYTEEIECPDDFYRVFRKHALNAYKRYARYAEKHVSLTSVSETTKIDTSSVEYEEIVNSLDARQRVFVDARVKGYSYREIAGSMNMTTTREVWKLSQAVKAALTARIERIML